jgi:hypothetical protein
LQEIGDRAFAGTDIERFEIPPRCEVLSPHSLEDVKSVCVSKESPFFAVDNEMLMSSDCKKLIRYLGSERQVVVKKEIEVIGEKCFGSPHREALFEKNSSHLVVLFEEGSALREIKEFAFCDTFLEKLEIPSKCQILNALSLEDVKSVTVSKENPFFAVEDEMLMSSDRKRLIRYFGSESRIVVKKEVEVIGEYCFCQRADLCDVIFENGSELKEIRDQAFLGTFLDEFEIPSKCEVLNGLSLKDVKSVTVSKENPFLVVEDSFLKSSDKKRLIWYMGSECQVVVKKEVEVIGKNCFYGCKSVCEVVFERGSRLRLIEDGAFRGTGARKVIIPASVEVVGQYSFLCCFNLCEVLFEEGSELKEIKDWTFGGTKVDRLEIPSKCQILNGRSLKEVKSFTVSKENPFLVIE